MKLETIYNELLEFTKEQNFTKLQDLLSKIEEQIRLETSYKTTSKTRVNAIKRVASKMECRPAFTGYSIQNGYNFVTDTYHMIAIKQDDMPLPLVATSDKLKELGINLEEYRQKYGIESVLNYDYPNMTQFLNFDRSQELPMIDMNDLTSFIKLHKKGDEFYKIGEGFYNPQFVKNVIDVLGIENTKIYYQGENRPLYFENDKNEIGLLLPIRKY